MRSHACALVIPSPVHAHPTQVIGKMSIERRAIAPFRVGCMKRLEKDSDDMLNKLLHIQSCLTDVKWAPGKSVTKARVEDL